MATFTWRATNGGGFDAAGNWSNDTTGENPASSVPGINDIARMASFGGTLTGSGSVNSLFFSAGGWIVGGDLTASAASIDSASVSVASAAAKLVVNGAFSAGFSGSAAVSVSNAGRLVVTAGSGGPASNFGTATLRVALGGIASLGGPVNFGSNGGSSVATVDAAVLTVGGVWQLGSAFNGIGGGSGSLTVQNGGQVALTAGSDIGAGASYLQLGAAAGTTGTAQVIGTNSILLVASNSGAIGRAGVGQLTVTAGGAARFNSGNNALNPALGIGLLGGSSGTVVVVNSGSTVAANGTITVGNLGSGVLRVLAGASATSAGLVPTQSALSVAAGAGSSGTLQIDGPGSTLVASGAAVIGGDNRGYGFTTGGVGTVSVTNGGALSSGSLVIYGGSQISVDGASQEGVSGDVDAAGALFSSGTLSISGTLSGTGLLQLGAGVADIGTLGAIGSRTTVRFAGASAVLKARALAGSTSISGLQYGNRIDLVGNTSVRLAGTVVTTATGTIQLEAVPHAQYALSSDGAGGTNVSLTPDSIGVFRFFDSNYGTHFFSSSSTEKDSVIGGRPDLIYEGVGLQAVDPAGNDPNAASVYRFFDATYGTHFFTASMAERDQVISSRADLIYEGTGFLEHTASQQFDTPVFRFFDTRFGTHFYTADASESASIKATRADLAYEGIGFYAPKF